MDWILNPVGLSLLALLVVALVVAWWEHRKRLREVTRRLAVSERSRRELTARAQALGAQLGEARAAGVLAQAGAGSAGSTPGGAVSPTDAVRLEERHGQRPERGPERHRHPRPEPRHAQPADSRADRRAAPRPERLDERLDERPGERAARIAAVSAAVDRMAAGRDDTATWADTQPLAFGGADFGYEATMPAPLDPTPTPATPPRDLEHARH